MSERIMRARVNNWLVGLSLFVAGVLPPFSSARSETLEDALIVAYSTNPDLQAARAQLRAIDEGVNQAQSGWLPHVQIVATYGYTHRRSTPNFSPISLQQLHPSDASASVTQTLYSGGRVYYSVRRAKANVRAGRADLRDTEQQVLLGVVTSYTDVQRDQAVVDLNRNNVDVLKRQLEATRDRFDVGQLTRTDVSQAEARLAAAVTQLTAAEAQLTASRSAYLRVVGQAPGTLGPPPVPPALPPTEDEALVIGLKESPTLVAAREREIASRFSVAVARGGLLPTVQIVGELDHNEDQSIKGAQSDSRAVYAQATWPLYQGGEEWSLIRQARQVNTQNIQLIASAERGVTESVANSWEQLRSARSQVESSREQVRANELAYEGVRQEAQVGSRTTLDALNAEQELLNSKVSLVTSQRNAYVAGYQLLSAVGRLSAKSIGLPVDPYEPEAYYRKAKWKLIGGSARVPK